MLTDDYRVRLEAFEGPLDLLLYLIRKSEVDVQNIPVAAVTEQYMRFLEGIERIDIDLAGEFLVMAATLMEIKSRMLAAGAAKSEEAPASEGRAAKEQEDPRAELVRQLLAYKKFRDAAEALEHRAEDWGKRFPAGVAGLDQERLREAMEATAAEVEIEDLDLLDLVEAFRKITEAVNFERLGEHQVTYDDTPVELHAEDILGRLREGAGGGETQEMELGSIFRGRTRSEMVGLFLAVLHLVRKRRVAVRQERSEGVVYLKLREQEEEGEDPGS